MYSDTHKRVHLYELVYHRYRRRTPEDVNLIPSVIFIYRKFFTQIMKRGLKKKTTITQNTSKIKE